MFARTQRVASNRRDLLPAFVEALETRRLLSAGPSVPAPATAVLVAGELRVVGTKGDDVILVSLNETDATKLDVNVNGSVLGSFALGDVSKGRVDVRAGKGDDSVRVDESFGLVSLSLVAHGEQGNDTLVGGSADDELHGDQGEDVLYGNDGNDALFGDQSNDMLAGGFGDDDLDGGNGSDTLYGESGADNLYGGNGKDSVDGGDDADVVDGGRGCDLLTGGLGADTFAGTERAKELLDKVDGEDLYTPVSRRGGGSGHDANDDDLASAGDHHGGK
jgi:Ca2+-binding RTX toxin-like protein